VTSQQDQQYDIGADPSIAESDQEQPVARHESLADENMLGRSSADELEDEGLDEVEVDEPESGLSEPGTFTAGAGAAGDGEASAADYTPADDDVIVAEVIEELPPTAASSTGVVTPDQENGLGPQWHDIQATFVDDPKGAVQMAAEATNTALAGLIDSLRARQDTLDGATGRATAGDQDTEQLRSELRQYRTLCQNLAEIGQRLADLQPA
jgi:hypothetical protein